VIQGHCIVCGVTLVGASFCSVKCEAASKDVIARAVLAERDRILNVFAQMVFGRDVRRRLDDAISRLREGS
jgi:predicted nucleic acid-binding Zn ribbon protein